MHKSLTAELRGHSKVKTVLVTPGQMDTGLFRNVKTPSNFLAPLVSPVEMAKDIVKLIDSGNGGHLSGPAYAQFIGWGAWAVLPASVQKLVRYVGGIDEVVLPAISAWEGTDS